MKDARGAPIELGDFVVSGRPKSKGCPLLLFGEVIGIAANGAWKSIKIKTATRLVVRNAPDVVVLPRE